MKQSSFKAFAASAFIAFMAMPPAAAAQPIKLKLSYFSSDRSQSNLHAIKPFVDAVNAESKGLVEIEVYFSGTLGKLQAQQPQLVLDGVADIAFVVPGQTPNQFPDTAVIELPGLFRDTREATLSYTRLIAANALKGYEEFFVIGAFSSYPNFINSRNRLTSLADLKGMKIRTNNLIEAAALERLGAVPIVLAIPQTLDAISSRSIDGAMLPAYALFEFGIGRVTNNHFLLRTSAAPLALVMNRKKFDSLPEQAKNIIRKYSGEWTAAQFIEGSQSLERQELERIKSDSRRNVVFPSSADLETALVAFKSIILEWTVADARHRKLLMLVEAELAKIRSIE
jgi:TRAP-type C4-dicarboxylate transport system substrate-binding protein